MSSPAAKRLAAIKAKASNSSGYKSLSQLPTAVLFTIDHFSYAKSFFEHPEKKIHMWNLVPHFTAAGINLNTHLPGEFSETTEDDIKETVKLFNDDIKDGTIMKFAFYGMMQGKAITRIHMNDEGLDNELLEEVKQWENNILTTPNRNESAGTASPNQSPYKKFRQEKGTAKQLFKDDL